MAHIIIDGYNIIGTAHQNLEKERNGLIEELTRYAKVKKHDITVVFDGWKDGSGTETVLKTGGIRVIYSRIAEKADRVIMRIIAEEKKAWIVISSDREIADFAWSREMVPVTSEEFERKLYTAIESKDYTSEPFPDDEEENDAPYPAKQTGRQARRLKRRQKPSKKMKMKLRALAKL